MNKKLYNMMDWAAIEEIVYAESVHPDEYLGSHNAGRSSVIQCFFPEAENVDLILDDKTVIKMDMMDEDGYFAALVPSKNVKGYEYKVKYNDAKKGTKKYLESYIGKNILSEEELDLIDSGSDYEVYNILGAHERTIDGVKGVLFAVYAPYALRVSVVGDFNFFNSKASQMILHDNYGVYELFIPGVKAGDKYQFEILVKGGRKLIKCDPYSFSSIKENNVIYSVVSHCFEYNWKDAAFIKNRNNELNSKVFNIYEICAQTYSNKYCLKDNTHMIIEHCKKYGYTHVELMPIFENYNYSLGFRPSFLFSVNKSIGTLDEIAYFVNSLHSENIGVILEMSLSSFDENSLFMSSFDGSCVYEHEDARKGIDPRTGAKIFQYGNTYVNQFVLSAVNYYMDILHFDGIKIMDLSNMLYLDYYRNDFDWVPNIYGSNENLEAVSFIRKLNKFLHKNYPGIITIAEEETGWPFITVTEDISEEELSECLLFDYCICNGFNQDVIPYLNLDPIERASHHGELTLSLNYQYRENYILALSHSDIDFGKGGLINSMFGDDNIKLANLKLFYAYMMTRPGKKCVFMGQDEADINAFDGKNILYNFNDLDVSKKKNVFSQYYIDLIKIISENNAFYKYDYKEKGFSWINNFSAKENVIVYRRNGDINEETFIVILNFANTTYDKYKIGVPFEGKYKEVFNSDFKEYCGEGKINSRLLISRNKECDGLDNSILLKLAPLSAVILSYIPYTKEEIKMREDKKKQKEKEIAEKKKCQENLRKQKLKIRASLKEELEQKIREAEEAIYNGSEYNKK